MAARMADGRRWWLVPLMLGLCGSASSSEPVPAADPADAAIPGTYEIWICRGLCASSDSANVAVKGHVVLFAEALDRQTVHRLDASYYPSTSRERPNGCYALSRVHPYGYVGYAGISPFGITGWYTQEGSIMFSLFHSTDAGYQAVVKPTPGGLMGQGGTWGAGAAAPASPDSQTVLARKVGEPDVRLCEAWAAKPH